MLDMFEKVMFWATMAVAVAAVAMDIFVWRP